MTHLRFVEEGASCTIVAANGKRLATYCWGRERNAPYFHPLFSYGSKEPLTTLAPFDHRWHKGLWWSWKLINGVVFWEDEMGYGGYGGDLGSTQVVSHAVTANAGSIRIEQELESRVTRTAELLLREARSLAIAPSAGALRGGWMIDWDLTFTAQVDCALDVTPYPSVGHGGYMGLSYRPARSMAWGEEIVDADGRTGAPACHGMSARWGAYTGNMDGDGTDSRGAPARAGVVLLDHPENPRYPTPFYSWSGSDDRTSFGFLAASVLMHGPMTLPAGESLHLRYRSACYDGDADVQAISSLHGHFAAAR
jgi:hypothetical protein